MKDREGKFVTVRIQSGEEEEIPKESVSPFFFWQHADDDFSGALVIVH